MRKKARQQHEWRGPTSVMPKRGGADSGESPWPGDARFALSEFYQFDPVRGDARLSDHQKDA